jgi:hypothetical protein
MRFLACTSATVRVLLFIALIAWSLMPLITQIAGQIPENVRFVTSITVSTS